MQQPTVSKELTQLSPLLRRAFGPLKKRALGLAVGLAFAGLMFLITARHLTFPNAVADPDSWPFGTDPVGHLRLLGQYFAGYEPDTWTGALIGSSWAGGAGYLLGVAMAALRNTVVRISLFVVRARGNLDANKGFLDQI